MPERPVRDLVVLIMVVTVSAVLLVSVVGLVTIQLFRPETDSSAVAGALGHVVQILVGAVLGFLAGRGAGRGE
jgi:hypothetical protein